MKRLVKYQSIQTQPIPSQEQPPLKRIFSSQSCTLSINKQKSIKKNQPLLSPIKKLPGQGFSHRIKNGQFNNAIIHKRAYLQNPKSAKQNQFSQPLVISKKTKKYKQTCEQSNNKTLFLNPKLCIEDQPIAKAKSTFLKKRTSIQKSMLYGIFKKRLSQQCLVLKNDKNMKNPQKKEIDQYAKIFGQQSPSNKISNLIQLLSRYYEQQQQNIRLRESKSKLYDSQYPEQHFHQLKAKKNW